MAARISAARSGIGAAAGRAAAGAGAAGAGQVQEPGDEPGGGLPGALLAGSAARLAEPGPGDRPGQHLDDRVLAVAERGGCTGQGSQRVGLVRAQRQDLGAGQPQRPAGGQDPGRERRGGG